MKTKGEIEFEILDTTAITDCRLRVPDNNIQNYSKLDEIVLEDIERKKYFTLENNFSVLDGNLVLIDENDNVGNGFSSCSMTDENGNFDWYSRLDINFNEYHTSPGITIVFNGDSWATDFSIIYCRDNEVIHENTYSANQLNYYCEEASVEKYNKIIIVFRKMSNGNRFVKISKIYFGCIKVFSEDLLISSKTTQEIDLLSSELAISKVDFKVSNNDRKFSLLNPDGIYSSLQDKQKIRAYEYLDDRKVLLGTFYLNSWKNSSEQVAQFEGKDAIGLMDNTTFYGGMYTNILSENLISEIFNNTGIKYNLADNLKGIAISGYLPKSSNREALQQVLFILGAIATTSSSEVVEIYIPETTLVQSRITKSRKHTKKNEVSLYDIVTGVDVTSYSYSVKANAEELYKETIDKGEYIIDFNNPVSTDTISVQNATVLKKHVNYIKISVNKDNAQVIVTGKIFEEQKTITEFRKERLAEAENNLSIKDVTLINKSNVRAIGKRILEFYNKKYKMECQFKLDNEGVGKCVSIDSLYESRIFGNIQSMTIDMTGGAIVQCTALGLLLRGYNEYNCCGELYCNDSFYRERN